MLIFSLSISFSSYINCQKNNIVENLEWRNIGPDRGGRSLAVSGSSSRINEYYFGAVGGGLWKTTDGGITWDPITDGQINSSSVGAVAVADSNPDILFIGMGETELRGNIMQGDGVYRSNNAGKSWKIGIQNPFSVSDNASIIVDNKFKFLAIASSGEYRMNQTVILSGYDLDGDTLEYLLAKLCLLYTSPSPRDRQKSRMPSSA